ncbi:lipase 3-like, partial [Teleopsis dalmanni]|uniref:lipase 3-like n=1 Tax=Teleopsis dalmanni TaxID=139649 RepID=UPI0018CFE6DB
FKDQRIRDHGYPAEKHKTITEDGYIITLFRIPYSNKLQNQDAYRPIVLLQHGLFSCSDAWILTGPENALPFILADNGFDVWFGNARGNTYSRNHTTISLKHPNFWRFSWHEIGYYDIPAMIDYAIATNGQNQKSIHYVGHSQGTTVNLVLLSSRTEYNAKMKTVHLFAPVAFMSNMNDKLVRTLAPYLGHTNVYSALFGSQEFVPHNDLFMLLAYNACGSESILLGLCTSISYMLEGEETNTNRTALPLLAETHPAGASTDQICHYMQEQQSGYFRRFDFGSSKNMKMYGQSTPPDYTVDQITAELHLWYSDNDDLAAVVDVEKLADLLPNRELHHVEDPTWAHGDFTMAMEAPTVINEPVIDIMLDYEQRHGNER